MPVLMVLDWDGIGVAEYEALRARVGWKEEVPPGALFHAAAKTDDGMRAVDLWESAEAFQRFVDERLVPAAAELGIPGAPRVDLRPTVDVFTPGYQPRG